MSRLSDELASASLEMQPSEENDQNLPGDVFLSDKFMFWRLVMKRIRILVLILCACFASVAWGQQPASKCSNNWSQFSRNNMERFNPCEKVLNVNNVGSLHKKWRHLLGGFYSSPSVADGMVYVGSGDGNVYAFRAKSGHLLWSYTTDGAIYSSPAVANGVVYIATDTVYALNAETGALLWSYFGGSGSPAVVNGVVYADSGNNVIALNASTGALLWGYATGNTVASSPAVKDGVVYVSSGDNNLYALNASTGALLWTYNMGTLADSSAAVGNGVVYMGQTGDGYCPTRDTYCEVYALNATTGALLWKHARWGRWSSPAVAHSVVYIASEDGNVYAFRAKSGKLLWSFATNGQLFSSPAVANGVVYIATDTVYALNAETGALLWNHAVDGYVDSSPAVAGGVLYVTSVRDTLYAFGLPKSRE